MLSSRDSEADRVAALETGAFDYITKPFSPRELVARVKVILRRVQGGVKQSGVIRAQDLAIDTPVSYTHLTLPTSDLV